MGKQQAIVTDKNNPLYINIVQENEQSTSEAVTFWGRLRRIELKDWLTTTSILIAAITLSINACSNFSKSKWEKTQFLVEEIRKIKSEADNKLAIDFFRYNISTLELYTDKTGADRWVIVSDDLLVQALEVDQNRNDYTETEVRVRSILNNFLDDFSFFNRYIDDGIITEKEAELYLKDWLKVLDYRKRKSNKFQEKFSNYLKYYGYGEVSDLLEKYDKQQNRMK
ncbi:hypothetical protein [Spirosoma aerolatum]|uniref:hypothetical protein n=1 Tax=Spirosoma aerolatum TaxID=1211326 RepID=UPI0009AEB193|nr:hypothetical protein [Spirosoma aerolatum]